MELEFEESEANSLEIKYNVIHIASEDNRHLRHKAEKIIRNLESNDTETEPIEDVNEVLNDKIDIPKRGALGYVRQALRVIKRTDHKDSYNRVKRHFELILETQYIPLRVELLNTKYELEMAQKEIPVDQDKVKKLEETYQKHFKKCKEVSDDLEKKIKNLNKHKNE